MLGGKFRRITDQVTCAAQCIDIEISFVSSVRIEYETIRYTMGYNRLLLFYFLNAFFILSLFFSCTLITPFTMLQAKWQYIVFYYKQFVLG